jgi:ribonuclease HI
LNGYTLAFFDGASIVRGSGCGAGGSLKIIDGSVVRWFFNCGEGSNTKAELVGAWESLSIAKILEIQHVHILGDSKIVIEWLKHNGNLQAINIEGWKRRILWCQLSNVLVSNTSSENPIRKQIFYQRRLSQHLEEDLLTTIGME